MDYAAASPPHPHPQVFGSGSAVKRKIKGIYMWGSVGGLHSKASLRCRHQPDPPIPSPPTPALPPGSGKTMLMDLFCDKVAVHRKRRAHFHAFMQEVHARELSPHSPAHSCACPVQCRAALPLP